MADKIADTERAKYSKMWEFDSYRERSPGLRHLPDALQRMKPEPGASIVDFGCGTGRVAKALAEDGYLVTAVDIAENACNEFDGTFVVASLWGLPESLGRHDYGFCADVMEHLPTPKVDDTLANIAKHARTTYFQIANFHCHEGDKIGESLHLTVKSYGWWQAHIGKHFDIISGNAAPKHHIFVCRSRAF